MSERLCPRPLSLSLLSVEQSNEKSDPRRSDFGNLHFNETPLFRAQKGCVELDTSSEKQTKKILKTNVYLRCCAHSLTDKPSIRIDQLNDAVVIFGILVLQPTTLNDFHCIK